MLEIVKEKINGMNLVTLFVLTHLWYILFAFVMFSCDADFSSSQSIQCSFPPLKILASYYVFGSYIPLVHVPALLPIIFYVQLRKSKYKSPNVHPIVVVAVLLLVYIGLFILDKLYM